MVRIIGAREGQELRVAPGDDADDGHERLALPEPAPQAMHGEAGVAVAVDARGDGYVVRVEVDLHVDPAA